MKRFATTAVAICLLAGLWNATAGHANAGTGHGARGRPSPLHATRQSESDLEVGGELAGLPAGSTRFLSYKDLLLLPQVGYAVSGDSNFGRTVRLGGISLEELARDLGAPGAQMVVAICYDGYRTNYPGAYMAAHRPLLVLRIDGKSPGDWPGAPGGRSFAPYLISHPSFKPSFQVLSHVDEQQIPFGVTRIEFRNEESVLGAIAPPGARSYAATSPVMNGYRIAQQNCFRCHNMGREGGQMAGRSWQVLGMWAATEPGYFARYVKNPQAIDAKDRMPGNPQYDAATIEALRRYFATFAPVNPAGGGR